MTTPRPPLDRSALERVLARAAELQAQSTADGENTGGLSDDQVLELGKEVGLTPDGLRQAIAEERGRIVVPTPKELTGGWFGATTLMTTRIVPGPAPSVLATLDTAMRGELPFDVKRRFSDRMLWEPRRGFLDAMRSQFAGTAEGADLRLAEDIGGSVTPVDANRTHVRLDATLKKERSDAVASTVWSAIGAAGFGVGFVALGVMLPVAIPAAAAIAAGGAYAARSRFRSRAFRVATAMEQLLDRLEFGPAQKRGRSIVDKLLG